MYVDIKLNIQSIVLLGIIGGLVHVINKKNMTISRLEKENIELRAVKGE